jgi:hypothetical protein
MLWLVIERRVYDRSHGPGTLVSNNLLQLDMSQAYSTGNASMYSSHASKTAGKIERHSHLGWHTALRHATCLAPANCCIGGEFGEHRMTIPRCCFSNENWKWCPREYYFFKKHVVISPLKGRLPIKAELKLIS